MNRNIAIIGAGNLAWHLAPALENVGYCVLEVFSRDRRNAAELCKNLYNAHVHESLDFSEALCEIFILALADDALESVAQEIAVPEGAIIIHTSGSQPLSVLGYTGTDHIGVLYPLQTFSKGKSISFSDIPIFIEGDTSLVLSHLRELANSISNHVSLGSSADRKVIHLSAVFACNFTNHLFSIAREILEQKGLDYETLHPLISEMVNKSIEIGPHLSQTGPAIRNDSATVQNHLQYLSNQEHYAEIYSLLSESIMRMHLNKP